MGTGNKPRRRPAGGQRESDYREPREVFLFQHGELVVEALTDPGVR
jgi:hypothetical protein